MDRKKWLIIVLGALMLLPACTNASGKDPIRQALDPIFLNLPESIASDLTEGLVYMRFVMFVIAFALLNYALGYIFKDEAHKRTRIIIALSIGLLSTIAIPHAVIIAVVQSYSGLMGALFGLLPAIAGLAVIHKSFSEDTPFSHIMKAIIYILIAYTLGIFWESMGPAMATASEAWPGAGYFYQQLGTWLPLAIIAIVVAAIVNIFNLFSRGASGTISGTRSDYSRAFPPSRQSKKAGNETATEEVQAAETAEKEATTATENKARAEEEAKTLEELQKRAASLPTRL